MHKNRSKGNIFHSPKCASLISLSSIHITSTLLIYVTLVYRNGHYRINGYPENEIPTSSNGLIPTLKLQVCDSFY